MATSRSRKTSEKADQTDNSRIQHTKDPQDHPDSTPDVDPNPAVNPPPDENATDREADADDSERSALQQIASGQVVSAGKLIRIAQDALASKDK